MKLEDADFLRLSRYMKDNYGVNLEKKRALIEGRLSTTLARQGYSSFSEYIDKVMVDKSGDEISLLITKLTTNYTYFMREQQHYDFLKAKVLPELAQKLTNKDIRTWSAGCSSGEEPYTTAMLYHEFFALSKAQWDTTILATDISDKVLAQARKGRYAVESASRLPENWKKTYFKKLDESNLEIIPELKKEVVFSHFNLMEKTFKFKKKFHIIFCRNVMIYFDNATREELAGRFYQVLEPGGYLFIGLSETMANVKNEFKYVMPSIYRKEK